MVTAISWVFPPEDPERIEALAATFDGPALASSNKALQARLDGGHHALAMVPASVGVFAGAGVRILGSQYN